MSLAISIVLWLLLVGLLWGDLKRGGAPFWLSWGPAVAMIAVAAFFGPGWGVLLYGAWALGVYHFVHSKL